MTGFNGYSQAINKQLKRHGSLFQGRVKHILVDKDAYLVHLARYIHYNPVDANLVVAPEKWPYSNYLEWIGLRSGTLVNISFIRSYFPTSEDYQQFMEDYIIEKKLADELEKYLLDSYPFKGSEPFKGFKPNDVEEHPERNRKMRIAFRARKSS